MTGVKKSRCICMHVSAVSKRFLPNGKTETTAILRKGDGFGVSTTRGYVHHAEHDILVASISSDRMPDARFCQ